MKRVFLFLPLLLAAITTNLYAFVEFPFPNATLVRWDDRSIQIAGAAGRELAVMNTWENRMATTTELHGTPITALAWGADNTLLASGDKSGRVVVITPGTLTAVQTFEAEKGSVTALAFDAKGENLAVAYADNSISVITVATGEEQITVTPEEHIGSVTTLAWGYSTRYTAILIGGTRGYVTYSPKDATFNPSISTDNVAVTAAKFLPRQSGFAIGLANGTVIVQKGIVFVPNIYTITTGINEPVKAFQLIISNQVMGVAVGSSICYWHIENKTLHKRYDLSGPILSIDLPSWDEVQYPAVSDGKKIFLYDLSTATSVSASAPPVSCTVHTFPNPATDLLSASVQLANAGNVRIVLTDGFGRECAVMFDGVQHSTADTYTAPTQALAAGVYYLVVTTRNGTTSHPVTIAR